MELSVSGDRRGNTGWGIWGHGNVGIWDVGGVIWDLGTPCTVVSVGPSGGSRTARCPPSAGTAVGDPDGGGVWAVPGAGGSPGVAPSRGRAAAAAAPCGATPCPAALPPPGELQHFCAVLHVLHAVFCVFCVTHCVLHVRCMLCTHGATCVLCVVTRCTFAVCFVCMLQCVCGLHALMHWHGMHCVACCTAHVSLARCTPSCTSDVCHACYVAHSFSHMLHVPCVFARCM